MKTNPAVERLAEQMFASNRQGAKRLTEELLAAGMDKQTLLSEVLDPALESVGKHWHAELISLSQAFVVAKIAEDVLHICLPDPTDGSRSSKGTVVIGNIEDDFHSLGRKIVRSFLEVAGWEVHDVGNDVLAEDFIEKALEVNASIIAASAMMQTTALNIKKLRDLIDERGLNNQIKLAVGGAVFNWRPELIDEVGADGSAANAAGVDRLFESLQAEVSK